VLSTLDDRFWVLCMQAHQISKVLAGICSHGQANVIAQLAEIL